MALQTKGRTAVCSTIGDIHKHEKFKKLSKSQRIEMLQETYDKYGVLSSEFFVQVKPFIMWTIYRHLRGMPTAYIEDLVNNAYEELVIAFNGGNTTHYNEPVYKEAKYGTEEYYRRYKNIGNFVMGVVGSSVAKYRSKTYRRKLVHEDDTADISERISFTDFEINHDLDYCMEEPEFTPLFTYFELSAELRAHLEKIRELKPRNNVLYNFMLWKEKVLGE